MLRTDAVLCALVGIAFLAGARPLAGLVDALSEDQAIAVVRGLGVFLLILAVDLALASRARACRLPTALMVFGVANAAWVVATLVVVAAGWLTPLGIALALGSAAAVAMFAFEELRTVGAMRGSSHASTRRIL